MTHLKCFCNVEMVSFLRGLFVTGLLMGMLLICSPAQADSGGGDGPGGVGNTDGSSNLKLWLKADDGVYSNTSCTTPAGNDSFVACWADQSGNGYDFTQGTAGYQPTYRTNGINARSTLQFDGISQFLERSYTVDLNGGSFTAYIVAIATAGAGTIRSPLASICNASGWSGYIFYAADSDWWNFWARKSTGWSRETGVEVDSLKWHIFSGSYDDQITGAQLFEIDGTNYGEQYFTPYINNPSCPMRIGAGETQQVSPGAYFPGDIAEVIIYNTALPLAQRVLINNYLNEKYNLEINNDRYFNRDPLYLEDVAGIGQESDGINHKAVSAGMILANDSFLKDNGDYILSGHTPADNDNINTDLPTEGDWADGNNQRWKRIWYLQVTNKDTQNGLVDITFDISDSGMLGNFTGVGSNYRLLKRTDTNGTFTDIASATLINGDQVLFDNVDVSLLDGYITLGTVNYVSSPTAITLYDLRGRSAEITLIISGLLLSIAGVIYLFAGLQKLK